MTQETETSRKAFLFVFTCACLGAIGQAGLLYHELSDRYPYKVMSFPPAVFYKTVADVGLFAAPMMAVLCGLFFGLKKIWLAGTLPVFLCPLVFSGVFKAMTLLRSWSGAADSGRNFDGTDPLSVAWGFLSYAATLALAGLAIGGLLTYLTKHFTRNL